MAARLLHAGEPPAGGIERDHHGDPDRIDDPQIVAIAVGKRQCRALLRHHEEGGWR